MWRATLSSIWDHAGWAAFAASIAARASSRVQFSAFPTISPLNGSILWITTISSTLYQNRMIAMKPRSVDVGHLMISQLQKRDTNGRHTSDRVLMQERHLLAVYYLSASLEKLTLRSCILLATKEWGSSFSSVMLLCRLLPVFSTVYAYHMITRKGVPYKAHSHSIICTTNTQMVHIT